MIEEQRGAIDYDEFGAGPTIVFVPGSCSTGAAWRPIVGLFQDRFRCITTSLLGYGGTAERRTPWDADIALNAEIVEAVVRRASCPVHLVGHSFGGLAALAVALRNRVPLLSLTIIEAPAPALLRHMGERKHFCEIRQMTDAYFAAFQAGDRAAISAMIDFYGGAGTFDALPPRVRDYAVATTPANMLDWAGAYGFQVTPAALAGIALPTLVLRGTASHPALQRANGLLGQAIANAVVVTLAGAGHFMISTHAADVARVLGHHLDACGVPAFGRRPQGIGRSAVERYVAAPEI